MHFFQITSIHVVDTMIRFIIKAQKFTGYYVCLIIIIIMKSVPPFNIHCNDIPKRNSMFATYFLKTWLLSMIRNYFLK